MVSLGPVHAMKYVHTGGMRWNAKEKELQAATSIPLKVLVLFFILFFGKRPEGCGDEALEALKTVDVGSESDMKTKPYHSFS